ncbi:ABC-type amino acid transport substrate-binding protein [Arthrobacter sp. V1I9]|jgi:ABC-type amino acid transport substrate-binding protein|uniref:transporter substrate-binding domain-containing protein n=1 Tax=Arthrobacter sp. V1I9 TaxID=3042275 RepID=UPI0027901BAF|nr:ABC transporter substrate-binding protein [Arthrobacter sp. V1I9]MDQ0870655.1 ABC-type amino acid transport substrate-binding protein [Arthrobacter sp. V1I9]
MRRRGIVAALLLVVLLMLTGCAGTFPADPQGTLKKAQGGTLRVGASMNGDWVRISAETGGQVRDSDVQGTEAELVRDFAAQLGAEVEWVAGSEQVLAEEIKHGGLDLVIGGLDDKTPWVTHAGITRPYVESRDGRGNLHKHVMLVPLGENAFLLELDKFLMAAKEQK